VQFTICKSLGRGGESPFKSRQAINRHH
jgi:hypothetical protein